MSRQSTLHLTALTLFTLPTTASAQAWLRDAGEVYVNTSFTRIEANRFYGPDKQQTDLANTYTQSTFSFYSEAGLIDQTLLLTLDGEIFRRNELANQGATEGAGDLRAGLWYGLIQTGDFRLAIGTLVGLPTGDDSPTAEGENRFTAELLPTGDGEVDIEPRIIAGYGFGRGAWPLAHYLVAEAGYAFRGEGIDDGVRYRLEFGTSIPRPFWDRFWLTGRFFGLESLASDEDAGRGFTGLGQGVTYTSLGVELYGRIYDRFGASIGADTVLRARNILSGLPVRFALSYTF